MSNLFKQIKFILLIALFLYPLTTYALEPQVDASYTVSAIVPSKVAKEKSEIYLNPNETLADPVSHKVFLKVIVRDTNNNPLPNLDVWVKTNRGAVDLIEILTGPDAGSQQHGPDGQGEQGKTDANGEISFSISSWTPGEAVVYITADNLVELDPQKVKFLPLPFPANLTLTVPLPGGGQIVLLSPPEEEKLSPVQQEAKKLANTGTKIAIPFWIFLVVLILLLIPPLFIIFAALSLRRIRRTERREMMLLGAIAEAEHIDHVREFLKKEGLGK